MTPVPPVGLWRFNAPPCFLNLKKMFKRFKFLQPPNPQHKWTWFFLANLIFRTFLLNRKLVAVRPLANLTVKNDLNKVPLNQTPPQPRPFFSSFFQTPQNCTKILVLALWGSCWPKRSSTFLKEGGGSIFTFQVGPYFIWDLAERMF